MNIMLLLTSGSIMQKNAEMIAKDPHGAIITIVSVSVVFFALIILYGAYTLIGKLVSGQISIPMRKPSSMSATSKGRPNAEEAAAIALALDQELNGETYAAIAMAMHRYMNEKVHDNESYIITIKRKKS